MMLSELSKEKKKSMANHRNKQHSLIESRNQTKQTNLLILKSLVGDEIKRHEIKIRRGWDKAGGKVTLTTLLMDLHPSASSHR
jgi:hypothetical protein